LTQSARDKAADLTQSARDKTADGSHSANKSAQHNQEQAAGLFGQVLYILICVTTKTRG